MRMHEWNWGFVDCVLQASYSPNKIALRIDHRQLLSSSTVLYYHQASISIILDHTNRRVDGNPILDYITGCTEIKKQLLEKVDA